MTGRLLVLAACFLGTAAFTSTAMRPELVPLRQPLASLPMTVAGWMGRDEPRFSDEILAVLGVDEYINRTYRRAGDRVSSSATSSGPNAPLWASLYVGFYQSQRQGDTIHSPMNCLPGAGWQPVSASRMQIAIAGRDTPIEVNRVLIQKGLDRHVVLYWYQSQGRVVASEYWSKFYMVYDAMRTNRSDGALVRVITPVVSSDGGELGAERHAVEFVQSLFPLIGRYLPS